MQTFQGIVFTRIQPWRDFQIRIRAPLIHSMILAILAQIWGVPTIPLLLPLHYIYKRKPSISVRAKF